MRPLQGRPAETGLLRSSQSTDEVHWLTGQGLVGNHILIRSTKQRGRGTIIWSVSFRLGWQTLAKAPTANESRALRPRLKERPGWTADFRGTDEEILSGSIFAKFAKEDSTAAGIVPRKLEERLVHC